MMLMTLTSQDFDQALSENKLLVIEFGADWCAPCNDIQRVMLSLQPDFPEFVFATVDIDKETSLAEEFQVLSVPSIMIVKNGAVIYAESGALSVGVFRDLLEQARHAEA